MCGIAGSFGVDGVPATITGMVEALEHRGPDAGGVWTSPDTRASLGHRRLAIVDLSPTGAQPMVSSSGRYVTAFNGEIYNYRDLRRELLAQGRRLIGQSDTEIMLEAVELWGIEETLARMNGMFAAAIYDQSLGTCYLFRDRLGVKPLYYRWVGRRLYFSSELTHAFAALGPREIDRTSLALYFRYNYIPAPRTVYRDVSKVLPGTLHEITPASAARGEFARTVTYWDSAERINANLALPPLSSTREQSVDLVEAALAASVGERMVADVPVGAFLSGGIDSSLVVAHMQQLSTRAVRTFTIGFDDPERNEAGYARAIAAHLGTDHTEFIVTEQDALDAVTQIPRMYGEPFADSSQIPTYLVSRLTRQSVTVALSGDGGDELFAGYGSYQTLRRAQRVLSYVPAAGYVAAAQVLRSRRVQRSLRARVGEQRYDWIFNALRLFARDHEARIPRGLHAHNSLPERLVLGIRPGDSIMPYRQSRGNVTERMMSHDTCVYLPDDILTKVDRASMAVALEVRAPFVDDWRLFELAWRLPFKHKTDSEGGKMVLKDALARHVPRPLFERPKMGFAIPLGRWLNGPLKDWVRECTEPARVAREGFLDPNEVAALVRKAESGQEWISYKLWAVCVFQSWLRDAHADHA